MKNNFKSGDKVLITGGTFISIFNKPVIVLSNLYDERYRLVEDFYIVYYPDAMWPATDRYQTVEGINLELVPE